MTSSLKDKSENRCEHGGKIFYYIRPHTSYAFIVLSNTEIFVFPRIKGKSLGKRISSQDPDFTNNFVKSCIPAAELTQRDLDVFEESPKGK